MASWLIRMHSSSGKSTGSRLAICSGLHACTHLRSRRWGLLMPFHFGPGGPTIRPSGARTTPESRSCTYSRNRSLVAILAIFGRRARRSACHCDRRSVVRRIGPGRRVAPELSRYGRRAPARPASDLPHAELLCTPDGDVLSLGERQVASGDSCRKDWFHAASVAEPPVCDGG